MRRDTGNHPRPDAPGNSQAEPPELKLQRALALHQRGQLAQARNLYQEILAAEPGHFQALHLLGVIALQSSDPSRAVELIGKAVAINPRDALVLYHQGSALQQLARLDAALDCYDRAIALEPGFAEAHSNRGLVLKDLGQLRAALASCERAIALRGDLAEAHFNRGIVLFGLGQWDAAIASYDQAIAVRADYPEACFNRGIALAQLNRLDAAVASFDQAIACRPEYLAAHVNRGNALMELGILDAALASYDRAMAIRSDDARIHVNRATVHQQLMQREAALADCEQAIALEPDYADAYYNRALIRLLAGDFERGWVDHEWRWHRQLRSSIRERRTYPQPLWLGESPLSGRRILLHAEQGLGDTLQFCRYVTHVAALGAHVILEVPRALAALLSRLDGVSELVVDGEPLPEFDCYCPLMSLPLAFRTTLSNVPGRVPYLRAGADKAEYWRRRLAEQRGEQRAPRVGLVWSGGFRPNQREVWAVNRRRNIPLSKLANLKLPDVEYFSLQKGSSAEAELAECIANGWDGPAVTDFSSELHDFSDTAALVEQLDLVISVDTSTAHLAGALGKPVWLLNRFDTCWRWLEDRTDSPWYPTLRLYRQQAPGDWEGVVRRVRQDLLQWATEAARGDRWR